MTSPCYGCTERKAMCHAVCEKPKEFEAWRKAQRDKRLLEAQVKDMAFDAIHKVRARQNIAERR